MSAKKIKRRTYLSGEMAERRQESCTSDGAVKTTTPKEIENILLKGLLVLLFIGFKL